MWIPNVCFALLACLALTFASDASADAVEVSNDNDVVNGDTTSIASLIATPGADGISLREAIVASQAAAPAGPHTVTFAPALSGSTILLGSQLFIFLQDVEINGLGADELELSGQNSTNLFRIDNRTVTIRDITLADGLNGGGGGAIENRGGLLTIIDSVIRDSVSTSALGGGIRNGAPGVLTIIRSALLNNSATAGGSGGAVFTFGDFRAYNSTFSGNMAGQGSAVCLRGPTHVLMNNTITANTAGAFEGALDTRAGTTELYNNIVAANLGGAMGGPDVKVLMPATVTVANSNLIGTNMGHTIADGVMGNLVGTNATPLDPMIGALAPNDASTPTHALLAGSPALDSADNATCLAAEIGNVDQRGVLRGYDADATPNTPAVGDCDRGAFELRLPPPAARVGCGGR